MISRFLVIGLICTATFGAKPSFAAPDEYDDSQSNPFRIAAYLMYPVGWLAEWIVFRPFHFMVSATEPQEAFFGHRPHPPVLAEPQPWHDYGPAQRTPRKVPPHRLSNLIGRRRSDRHVHILKPASFLRIQKKAL